MSKYSDAYFMARAINIAKRGQFTTTPNPNVGCVVVKDNQVLAEGWHKKAGEGHAEVNALAQLSLEQSSGATAYVTLEPCSHYGRTPPCAKRLIEAQVAKVVVAMLDPNPQVAGNGIKMLQSAGIEVVTGVLEQDAVALNPGFLSQMIRQRPFVQVKLACSIDGKTALSNGESKWITASDARRDVQKHRALSCAVLSTAKTVLRDDAKLSVRDGDLTFDYPLEANHGEIRQPLKIILDGSDLITQERAKQLALFEQTGQVLLVKSTQEVCWQADGVDSVCLSYTAEQGFCLDALMQLCSERQLNLVWVEAGSTLASSFIEQSLYDQLIVYMAPKILGANGLEVLPLGPYSGMAETKQLALCELKQVGQDIKLTFEQ